MKIKRIFTRLLMPKSIVLQNLEECLNQWCARNDEQARKSSVTNSSESNNFKMPKKMEMSLNLKGSFFLMDLSHLIGEDSFKELMQILKDFNPLDITETTVHEDTILCKGKTGVKTTIRRRWNVKAFLCILAIYIEAKKNRRAFLEEYDNLAQWDPLAECLGSDLPHVVPCLFHNLMEKEMVSIAG